jgi:FkbH-like protein
MSNRTILLKSLRTCISAKNQLAVIHSSLPHLEPPSGFDRWDFVYAVRELVADGMTLAFPTFTFSFCDGAPYDVKETPSETGVVGDWIRALPEAIRTPHPIYSYAVIGPLAEKIARCENTTTFGPDSALALFEKLNTRVIMLGCDWSYCTQFHHYEEEAKVPYRYFKDFKGSANYGRGPRKTSATMLVRSLDISAENDFSSVIDDLHGKGHIVSTPLWGGLAESASCQDIAALCRQALKENPWAYVRNRKKAGYLWDQFNKAQARSKLKIALLGSSNLEFMKDALALALSKLITDQGHDIYTPPFGQFPQSIINQKSALHKFEPDLAFFIDRLEDLLGVSRLDGVSEATLEDIVEQYISLIKSYRSTHRGWIVVNRFALPADTTFGSAGQSLSISPEKLVFRFNNELEDALKELPDTLLFDIDKIGRRLGSGDIFDPRLWYLGRFSYSDAFTAELAHRFAAQALAATGRSIRLIVVDLDNTLWGGVLGEVGVEGVAVGGDYPGNAFAGFQAVLKQLSQRGIALAICSKNDEAHALRAMEGLGAMALGPQDFAAWRINWMPKWKNVEDIAATVGLSLEHLLFIDDNPVEREQMQFELPMVKVLDLPDDPALYASSLLGSPWIDALSLTKEDLNRTNSYKAMEKVSSLRSSVANLDDFFASLGTRLTISKLSEENVARGLQLLAKTNQFNTTTQRHGRTDLDEIIRAGGDVLIIGSEDKFSDFENIGLMIIRWNHPRPDMAVVDSYLLSCRVLGKGIETGVLFWALDEAFRRGVGELSGQVIETERNTPCREIFKAAGFKPGPTPGEWRYSLAKHSSRIPSWLTIDFHGGENGET